MAGTPSWADGEQSQKRLKKRLKKRLFYIWPLSTSKGFGEDAEAGGLAEPRREDDTKMKKRRIYCHGLKGVMRVVGCALNRVVVQDFVVCVQCSCYEDGQPIKSPPSVPLGASLADRHGLPSSQGESVLDQKEPKRVGRKAETH